MRSILLILSILLACNISSYTQEQTIQLKLNEGYEYVFKKEDKSYLINGEDKRVSERTSTKVIKITVEKVNSDSTILVSLKYLENYKEGGLYNRLIDKVDFFYPEFKHGDIYLMNHDFKESLLCKYTFRFKLNLLNNEISLKNKMELLETFYDEIKEFEIKMKNAYISDLTKELYFIPDELITFLIWFNNSRLTAENNLENSQLHDKLVVRKKKTNQIGLGTNAPDKRISGKTYKKFWLDTDNGLITDYSTIRYDSLSLNTLERRIYQYKFNVKETQFRLLYSQKLPLEKLFISGTIENPLSNKLHIRYLDKPFGVDLKTKTIVLDKGGEFQTSIDYKNQGFLYIENENNNKYKLPGTYVFYAEPGDSIIFNSSGDELPWETSVSGTRIEEANFLEVLRKHVKSGKKESNSQTSLARSNLIFDEDLSFSIGRVNGKYVRNGRLEPLFRSLEKISEIAEKYKSQLPEKSFNYITKEAKSYFYAGIYHLAEISSKGFYYQELDQDAKNSLLKYSNVLDELNILDYYNDYGLYSRKFATFYLAYNFSKANKIHPLYITSLGWSYTAETELKMQFARMVLTGSPYYREMASTFNDILVEKHRIGSRVSRTPYMQELAVENFELLIKLCNDTEITDEAKNIIRQYGRLQPGDYIPEMELLDIEKRKVTLNDFKGDKPTIFCLSTIWSRARYEFDELASKNQEYNFVMVLEGSSFKQWKEYTERAEPVAKHLFLLNDTSTINDLFQKNIALFVLDKEGTLEGYARSNPGALELAKASLEPKKKELNKSQLQNIIIALVSILTILTLGLFVWKWRVRQRFRKEEQFRKLRELELTAIRSQMNPHFLFNALNSVQNLVQQNKGREAHLYLSDFAGLIRKVLRNSEKEEVSLAEELEMTKQYLNLEKLRFEFDYSVLVDDGIDPHNTLVPSMLLQPFVENAVIHGLQNKPDNRQLKVEVQRVDAGIMIKVEDNGIGREAAREIAKTKNGKGTKLIKERLKILQEKQGEKYSLNITDLKEGTRVEIVMPEEN